MAYYRNRGFEINENKTADFLENAVQKITTEEDIDTLTQLIKLYKKNVPLSRRKYVAAFLLQESLKHYHPSSKYSKHGSRDDSRSYKKDYKSDYKSVKKETSVKSLDSEETVKHTRVIIAPEDATSVFIGIGKNRRVYPRDLVGLLIAVVGLARDRIGDIKVLANYSFVQLYTEDANTVIEKLNGYDYRGRKLAVSYSHQKDGLEDEAQDSEMGAEDAAAYALAEKAAQDKEPFGSI